MKLIREGKLDFFPHHSMIPMGCIFVSKFVCVVYCGNCVCFVMRGCECMCVCMCVCVSVFSSLSWLFTCVFVLFFGSVLLVFYLALYAMCKVRCRQRIRCPQEESIFCRKPAWFQCNLPAYVFV